MLILVSDRHATLGRDLVDVVARATEAGVRWVQIRDKDLPRSARRELAERLRAAVHPLTTLFLSGDSELALELDLHLHLPEAEPYPAAWPKNRLIGRAVHSLEAVTAASSERLKYIVLGPIFETTSKPKMKGLGLAAVKQAAAIAGATPLFAIGGIDPRRLAQVRQAGALGAAVRSGILAAPDIEGAVQSYLE